MDNLLTTYEFEIVASLITVFALSLLRYIISKAIRKIGRISDISQTRTLLILKYLFFGYVLLLTAALIMIWGVNIREVGVLLSSAFAVLGVALFAQWSILSNVTSGVILFISFPYKIGDRIRIWDKDIENSGEFVIEDIRAYHLYLRSSNGELLTYPNNLMLQKAVSLLQVEADMDEEALTP